MEDVKHINTEIVSSLFNRTCGFRSSPVAFMFPQPLFMEKTEGKTINIE
jgi:hypothetical protein